jgi:hypothetical protein
MNRLATLAVVFTLLSAGVVRTAEVEPPNAGRGAATVPVWNPHRPTPDNPALAVRVLVLNYDPVVPAEGHRRLSQVFRWGNPAKLGADFKEAMEYASGGYLRFNIVEWRNLNEIYAQEDGNRYTVEEYVRNRRQGKGWRERGMADYPRLLREQNVVPLIDEGLVDEVWVFSDHFFGLWEASMAGPGAFFINGGVYPQVKLRRPFAFYGFNYERGVAEMMHDASHRTESTLNRAYGHWKLKGPKNHWEQFSANHDQSGGLAGVGTCHWPANAAGDYDYGNRRVVSSWADAFLNYPKLNLVRKPVSRDTWSKGPDYHLDYMKWYFAHVPRAAGVNEDGRQNNWFKYIFDFQSYDTKGKPLPAAAELLARDVADPKAVTHTLHVAYRSAEQIDPKTLGDSDLTVTGPDGKSLAVKLVGGKEPEGRSYRVARYEVGAPGGTWEKGDYSVALRPGRVCTGAGKVLPGGRLGVFRVASAVSEPTRPSETVNKNDPKARLVRADDVTKPGAGDVTIVVACDGPVDIRRDSLGLGNVRVVGPNGFHQFPELVSVEPATQGNGLTVSYRVSPPTGKWGEADRGVYTIEIKAYQVADTKGNHVREGVLGRFRVLQPADGR